MTGKGEFHAFLRLKEDSAAAKKTDDKRMINNTVLKNFEKRIVVYKDFTNVILIRC